MRSEEQLFLLEVLIERITLRRSLLETFYATRDAASLPLSVKVKFLDFPYLEINQEDFRQHECLTAASVGDFSTGKSCLFPMEPMELVKCIRKTPLRMVLMRKPPGACPPEILGNTDVFLTEEMCKTIRKAMTSMEEMPMSSILQDSYNLRNDKQEDVGFITVFVRLSCFGQSIVTQFKLVNETNSFLFKNSKETTSFECENCSCGQEEAEQKAKVSPCGCPADNVVPYSKDCDSKTCENKRIPMKPEQYPPPVEDCGCTDKTRTKSGSNICGDRAKSRVNVCGGDSSTSQSSSPCGICGTSQKKSQDCGPSYPCGACGQNKTKPQDCGPAYPCGVCDQGKKTKSNDCGPSYPCGVCGRSGNSKTKSSDCGPTFPCGVCGAGNKNKSQDCGPTFPCGVCGSDNKKNSQDCGPTYPCGVCGSKSSKKSQDCGPSYPCGVCGSTSSKKPQDCGPTYPCGVCGAQEKTQGCGPKSASRRSQEKSSCGENTQNRQQMCSKCCQSPQRREPMISSDEFCPSSQYPGEQENCGLACCECTDCFVEKDEFSDDDTCDTCPQCFNVLRPPFCERAEEDIVPVMPMYCSQDNLYDPELDQNTCPAKTQKRDEEWKQMLTCECENSQLSELYGQLKADNNGKPRNPPVRYDTTGCLSPAFGGELEAEEISIPTVRYDTTGILSAAYNHPPVRYDTTGAMSSAYLGGDPTLKYDTSHLDLRLVESTPGRLQSSLQDGAFKASGMRKQSFSEALIEVQAKKKKKVRSCWRPPPKSRKYIYTWGGSYPGVKIGHRFCLDSSSRVPSRMGWTWDKPSPGLAYRPGWRPGAVHKTVMRIMRAVKKAAGLKLKKLAQKDKGGLGDADTAKPQLPPTLHVHRREGAYYISMHPMNLEPEENNVPLQFRIPAKKKEEGEEDSCVCDESDASSELEIEFMAPGVYWPSDKDRKTANTQCFESEFPPDPEHQLLMELQAQQAQKKGGDGHGKHKGKKDKKCKKDKKDKKGKKGKRGKGDPESGPDPDTSPRVVGWDADDQPTAVGKKK